MPHNTKKLQSFDCEVDPVPPNTPAVPRPSDRSRVFDVSAAYHHPSLQLFDCEKVDLPEGTLAAPRPEGKERQWLPADEDSRDKVNPAKARWLEVIKQNMVPSEGDRLRIAEEGGLVGDHLEVKVGNVAGFSGIGLRGKEVSISSPEHLAVYRTEEDNRGGFEWVEYIPWESILCLNFCRRRPKE